MKIQIPGSSANLGSGFDCFGIAWKLYNEIEFCPGGEALNISGCPEEFQNRNNLCYRGYSEVLKRCGMEEKPLSISFGKSDVPISRGLGSSAALIAGGVFAANEINKLGLSRQELLSAATEVEGHPDNVSPALFGGFTASAMDGGKILSVSFKLSDKLHFTALIPDFKLSTELSRSVLPESCSRADAVFNISRSALLIKAMESGDAELLSSAIQDRIHQYYRFKLINGYETAREIADGLNAGGICISGAGPTLLCISESSSFSANMKEAMASALPGWKVLPLIPDTEGAKII